MLLSRPGNAVALACVLAGCTPMPKIDPPEQTVSLHAGVGDSVVYRTDREAVDVTAPQADRLTFADAVRRAVTHDPALQAAFARVRQAQAEARQTRLLPNPILAFAFRLPTSGGRPDVEASVTADLLSLLLRPGQISAADARLRKAVADSMTVALDLLEETRRQYVLAQTLAARLKIDDTRRGILDSLLGVTDARVRGGEATRLDQLTLQGEIAELRIDNAARLSEARLARLGLARLIGQPSAAGDWTLDDWAAPVVPAVDEETCVRDALERRPEINGTMWELAALGQEMKIARLTPFLAGGDAGVSAENTESDWTLGPAASVAIPLFDVGQAQRELIAARVTERRHDLTRLERQIVQDVRSAVEKLRTADAALRDADAKLIPLQTERLDQAKNAYRLGLADVLAVRLAEQDLESARSRVVELQSQVLQSVNQLQRATGGPSVATPATAPNRSRSE